MFHFLTEMDKKWLKWTNRKAKIGAIDGLKLIEMHQKWAKNEQKLVWNAARSDKNASKVDQMKVLWDHGVLINGQFFSNFSTNFDPPTQIWQFNEVWINKSPSHYFMHQAIFYVTWEKITTFTLIAVISIMQFKKILNINEVIRI